jgi:ribonuclease P protein component
MTTPGVPAEGQSGQPASEDPALLRLPPALRLPPVLSKRADFLKAAQGLRQGTEGFHLQARKRQPTETATGIRVGFTCSKKVGNAVARNRAKRRLREVARLVLPVTGRDGWDYVLVGRADITARLDFLRLQSDLTKAINRVHGTP